MGAAGSPRQEHGRTRLLLHHVASNRRRRYVLCFQYRIDPNNEFVPICSGQSDTRYTLLQTATLAMAHQRTVPQPEVIGLAPCYDLHWELQLAGR